jgi:hypothetical protein
MRQHWDKGVSKQILSAFLLSIEQPTCLFDDYLFLFFIKHCSFSLFLWELIVTFNIPR